jgi:hypothetical protein
MYSKSNPETSESFVGPPVGRAPLRAELWLLDTSRQVHAETHLLSFKLNAFQIPPENLRIFVNKLTNAQRDTITTFKVA